MHLLNLLLQHLLAPPKPRKHLEAQQLPGVQPFQEHLLILMLPQDRLLLRVPKAHPYLVLHLIQRCLEVLEHRLYLVLQPVHLHQDYLQHLLAQRNQQIQLLQKGL